MTTSNETTYMERQLLSLFRAEAQDAHLPQGTWQAISPKMGEPDAPSVLWQLRNAFSFPRWRNPMELKYAGPIGTVVFAAIAAILFVLLINDPDPPKVADEPPPAVETPGPQPTFTPLPATPDAATPTVQPEGTSTPLPASKAFPAELRSDSEPLPAEEVIALWTEYLAGTDVIGEHLSRLELRICGDGTGNSTITQANAGRRLVPIGSPNSSVDRMVFDWEVVQVSNRWNEITLRMPLTKGPGDTFEPLLDIQRFWEEDGVIIGRDYQSLSIVDVTDDANCTGN